MGSIKDKALKNSHDKEAKYTLTETEINTLMEYRNVAQQQLDRMLQELTTVYLHSIAVERFEYAPTCNLGFKLELDKPEGNITITNLG